MRRRREPLSRVVKRGRPGTREISQILFKASCFGAAKYLLAFVFVPFAVLNLSGRLADADQGQCDCRGGLHPAFLPGDEVRRDTPKPNR